MIQHIKYSSAQVHVIMGYMYLSAFILKAYSNWAEWDEFGWGVCRYVFRIVVHIYIHH